VCASVMAVFLCFCDDERQIVAVESSEARGVPRVMQGDGRL